MIANDCSSGAKFQGCCHSASGPLGLTFPVTRCTITEIAGHVGGVRHQSRFRGARSATQQTDADGAADGRRQGTPRSWRDAERPRLRSVAVVGCALGVEVQSAGLLEMVCVEAVECGCSLQMFAESSLQVLPCPGLGLLRLRAVEAAPLPCCLAVADVKSEKKGAGRCTGSRGEDARKPHADTGPCRGPQCDRRSSVRCAALCCAVSRDGHRGRPWTFSSPSCWERSPSRRRRGTLSPRSSLFASLRALRSKQASLELRASIEALGGLVSRQYRSASVRPQVLLTTAVSSADVRQVGEPCKALQGQCKANASMKDALSQKNKNIPEIEVLLRPCLDAECAQGPTTAAGDETSLCYAVLRCATQAPSCSPSSVQPTALKRRRRSRKPEAASPGSETAQHSHRKPPLAAHTWAFPRGLVPGGCQHLVCGTPADDQAEHQLEITRETSSRGLRVASSATVPCVKPLQSQGWPVAKWEGRRQPGV